MSEPEVALVFTPEPWVEEVHRHLTDHGGGRVRQVVVEPEVALEENYDVLVVSYRWPALTRAFVADVHARGRTVLGVFDREEPAARVHLVEIGVDEVLESDRGPRAFVEALVSLRARCADVVLVDEPLETKQRSGRIVVVGGVAGSGRTEIAVQLAAVAGDALVDADDVAPAVAARLALPIEPNLRTAIDAVEHGGSELQESLVRGSVGRAVVLPGLPNPNSWTHVRAGEVMRVVDQLATEDRVVIVDGPASLEDVGGPPRGRHAVSRALVMDADVIVGVCVATPLGVARFLSWVADARVLATETPIVVAVNRAPAARFRRGELYHEIVRSLPSWEVVFVADDRRVTDAVWDGRLVAPGPFTRGVARIAELVRA